MSGSETNLSDSELITRLQQADLDALGVLFERYRARVFRTALAIVRDPAVAEDILQDCFLKIYSNAQRIDADRPLAPWLYRVTVNLSYTWVSRQHKRRVSLEAVVDCLMSPTWLGPDQQAESIEIHDRVREAIRELNFNQRVVVVLHYLNGLSLEEIAEILKCPVGTVKSRLYYARENLRQRLETVNWMYQTAP